MDHTKAEPAEGLGGRVRTLRIRRGLKQQDLASADVSTSYISLIESGKRVPSTPVLASLAEKLDTSLTTCSPVSTTIAPRRTG